MTAAAQALEPAPPVLLPYQQRWVGDGSPVKLAEKSRRTGYTWATACEAVLVAGATNGQDVWYLGPDQELAREFISDAAEWSTRLDMAARTIAGAATLEGDSRVEEVLIRDDEKDILAYRITYGSGFRVSALTSSPRKFRGRSGYAIIDEAAFHDRLDELLKAAIAFLMWGGRVGIISTHNGVDNPFNKLIDDVRGGRKDWSLHRCTLDEALEEGLYRRICLVLRQEWTAQGELDWRARLIADYGEGADEELHVVPAKAGRKYLSGTLVEDCMYRAPVLRLTYSDEWATGGDEVRIEERDAEVLEWCESELRPLLAKLPRDRVHCLGEDFGRTSDLSVFAPVTLEQDLVRRIPFLVELRNVPHRHQEQILLYILDGLPRLSKVWMDAGGNGSALAEAAFEAKGGGVVERIHIRREWYAEQLPLFRAALQDSLVLIPRDVDVKTDLQSFELVEGVPRLPSTRVKGKSGPRHGDAGIALVMALGASRDDSAQSWLDTFGGKN